MNSFIPARLGPRTASICCAFCLVFIGFEANTAFADLIIDDFGIPPSPVVVAIDNNASPATPVPFGMAAAGVLGGWRRGSVEATSIGILGNEARLRVGGGFMTLNTDSTVNGQATLIYDANGAMLNTNLSPYSVIELVMVDADQVPLNTTITLTDGVTGGVQSASVTKTLTSTILFGTDPPYMFTFDLADFLVSNPSLNLSDITSMTVFLDSAANGDFTITQIQARNLLPEPAAITLWVCLGIFGCLIGNAARKKITRVG